MWERKREWTLVGGKLTCNYNVHSPPRTGRKGKMLNFVGKRDDRLTKLISAEKASIYFLSDWEPPGTTTEEVPFHVAQFDLTLISDWLNVNRLRKIFLRIKKFCFLCFFCFRWQLSFRLSLFELPADTNLLLPVSLLLCSDRRSFLSDKVDSFYILQGQQTCIL